MKNLVLAFPPYTLPMSPPLGVCSLAGHVRRSVPDWTVRVLDLNLEWHQEFFRALGKPSRPATLGINDANLRYAAELFLTGRDEDFHVRPRYLHFAQVWALAMRQPRFLRKTLEPAFRSGKMPDFIRRHADLVLKEQPSLVGISVCYAMQRWPALCLAKEISQRSDVPIVMGGTVFSDGVPTGWGGGERVADYVVVGAGERPLVEILQGRADEGAVPGVVRLRGGETVATAPVYDKDLDPLGTPDFSDLPLDSYFSPKPVVPLLTSRGCYWRRCAFCSHFQSSGDVYQLRSIEAVIDELRAHVQRGVHHFYLADSVVAPARFAQLAQAILDSGLEINYYAMARAEKQFDRALLEKIVRSGCRFVLWGLESGCQRVLDLMEKGTTVADVERILRTGSEVGLRNHVFVICGFPTEAGEEFQETVDLLVRNRDYIDVVHRTIFSLEENTVVHRSPEKYAITDMWPKTTPRLFDFTCSKGMNRSQVKAAFLAARPVMLTFSGHPSVPGDFKFREHCLLHYSQNFGAPRAPVPGSSER